MDLHAILIRSPVNRIAAAGILSKQTDGAITSDDLTQIVNRLQRKHRLLKRVLGISNKSQHKNSIWKSNKEIQQFRYQKEPRSFVEYKLIGRQIQHLNEELAAIKKARKAANAMRRSTCSTELKRC